MIQTPSPVLCIFQYSHWFSRFSSLEAQPMLVPKWPHGHWHGRLERTKPLLCVPRSPPPSRHLKHWRSSKKATSATLRNTAFESVSGARWVADLVYVMWITGALLPWGCLLPSLLHFWFVLDCTCRIFWGAKFLLGSPKVGPSGNGC